MILEFKNLDFGLVSAIGRRDITCCPSEHSRREPIHVMLYLICLMVSSNSFRVGWNPMIGLFCSEVGVIFIKEGIFSALFCSVSGGVLK